MAHEEVVFSNQHLANPLDLRQSRITWDTVRGRVVATLCLSLGDIGWPWVELGETWGGGGVLGKLAIW